MEELREVLKCVIVVSFMLILVVGFFWREPPKEVLPMNELPTPPDASKPAHWIGRTPTTPSQRGVAIAKGDWYSVYRNHIGLSHEEIVKRFPKAKNLDELKTRYESQ